MTDHLRFTAIILTFILLCASNENRAQRRYRSFGMQTNFEYGIGVGPTAYQGDLSLGIITWEKTKLNIGGFIRLKKTERLSFRAGINFGKIAGDDKEWGKYYSAADHPYGYGSTRQAAYYERYKRNLNFRSNIFEMNVLFEFNLYNPRARRPQGRPSPYLFGGLGYFHFNPKTTDRHGNTVELHQIPTELYKSYKLWQTCIPLGLGLRFNPDNSWYITVEIGYRKTFTDWIDDVHHNYAGPKAAGNIALQQLSDRSGEIQPDWGNNWDKVTLDPNYNLRGNPNNNDSYIFSMITFNKSIGRAANCTNF